jgi:hypothetical protein
MTQHIDFDLFGICLDDFDPFFGYESGWTRAQQQSNVTLFLDGLTGCGSYDLIF